MVTMSDYCKKCGEELIEERVVLSRFDLWRFNFLSFAPRVGRYNARTGEENEFFELKCPDYRDKLFNRHTVLGRVTTDL